MDKFLSDLIEVVKKDCEDYFIKKMQHSVQEAVYDEYSPTVYSRREERGGLKDPQNYNMQVFFDRDGRVCIYMKNLTRGVGAAYYIDEGIVSGQNFYDWKKSKAYYYATHGGFSRDFYTYMEVMVAGDAELERLIKKGMSKRGWKINLRG